MKILIVAATETEIKGMETWVNIQHFSSLRHEYSFLKTGIGIARATFATTQALHQQPYDFVIQVGIAGSFQKSVKIGDVVWVKRDIFSDLGADTQDGFLTLPQLGLEENPFELNFPETGFSTIPLPYDLPLAVGITSDTIHNREARIHEIFSLYKPDVESMEGAAIMFACQQMGVPNIQVRAISNIVAPRTRNEWDLDRALTALTNWGINYIQHLEKEGS